MKPIEKEWSEFTPQERTFICELYEQLMKHAAAFEIGLPKLYAIDPLGTRLLLERIDESVNKIKDKTGGGGTKPNITKKPTKRTKRKTVKKTKK